MVAEIVVEADVESPGAERFGPSVDVVEIPHVASVLTKHRARLASAAARGHLGRRPLPLDGVPEQVDDAKARKRVGRERDGRAVERRVLGCDLAARAVAFEQRPVPVERRGPEEVRGRPLAPLSLDFAVGAGAPVAPAFVAQLSPPPPGRSVLTVEVVEPGPWEPQLLVEEVEFLHRWQPDVGVLLESPVQPSGSGLLGTDPEERGSGHGTVSERRAWVRLRSFSAAHSSSIRSTNAASRTPIDPGSETPSAGSSAWGWLWSRPRHR